MKTNNANRYRSLHCIFYVLMLFFATLAPTSAAADHNSRDVLILHSYHPGLAWTAGINSAIQKQLLADRPDLSFHVEYLDTKRNQSEWYRDSYLDKVLVKKLTGHHFKLIISSDNDAFSFLLRHRNSLFAETPIVFCGVNGFTPQMLDGSTGITGVAETPAFKETVQLALQLHPEANELIFIGETVTATGQQNDQALRETSAPFAENSRITFWNDLPLAELEPRLEALVPGQVVFLASTINDNGVIYSFAESARQVRQHSPVPVYGFWDFFIDNGVVGGRVISSEAQGQEAAKLGLRILDGADANAIPATVGAANRFMFDHDELLRFGIPPEALPDASIIVNQPSSYYKLYKWHLWSGLFFIAMMVLCISLLLNILVIRRKSEKEISERERLASLAADIGRALTRDTSLQQTLQHCCESLLKQTETAFGRIWVTDENDPELLELHASCGLFTNIKDSSHRFKKFGEKKVGVIASERKPILTNQVLGDPLFTDQDWIARDKIVGFAGYPLMVHDRTIGVIALFSKSPLAEHVQHAIASVSDMIAVGIERYRTEQALQEAVRVAEAGRDNIDAILKSVTDGLIVTDLDQKIVLLNAAAEKLLDINFSKVSGISLTEAIKDRPYAEQLQIMLQESDTEVEFSVPGKNSDNQLIVHARTAGVQNISEGLSGTVAVLHDVTRQRELDQMKNEFIAVAAHELRTPLAAIQGYAELMYTPELATQITEEQQHEYLGYIVDRSEALERIIDDLLDVGRAESGRMLMLERSACEMISLVHEVVSHHRRENAIHTFVTDCPEACLKLNIDRNMMHRVFDNLLSNAAKYSPSGGTISLSGAVQKDDLVVTISDEGIGMTPAQVDQAFNKFYRVDPSDTAVRGLGLGLSICKAIIEAHGGKIWIDSKVEQGTAVHFSLPL